MFLGLLARREGSEVFSLFRLWIDMTRVDSELATLQFANHLRVPLVL